MRTNTATVTHGPHAGKFARRHAQKRRDLRRFRQIKWLVKYIIIGQAIYFCAAGLLAYLAPTFTVHFVPTNLIAAALPHDVFGVFTITQADFDAVGGGMPRDAYFHLLLVNTICSLVITIVMVGHWRVMRTLGVSVYRYYLAKPKKPLAKRIKLISIVRKNVRFHILFLLLLLLFTTLLFGPAYVSDDFLLALATDELSGVHPKIPGYLVGFLLGVGGPWWCYFITGLALLQLRRRQLRYSLDQMHAHLLQRQEQPKN